MDSCRRCKSVLWLSRFAFVTFVVFSCMECINGASHIFVAVAGCCRSDDGYKALLRQRCSTPGAVVAHSAYVEDCDLGREEDVDVFTVACRFVMVQICDARDTVVWM